MWRVRGGDKSDGGGADTRYSDFITGSYANPSQGLNVFNTACVLAKPSTATDGDYERVQAVVAHEYFHNWTGNVRLARSQRIPRTQTRNSVTCSVLTTPFSALPFNCFVASRSGSLVAIGFN